MKAKRLTPTTAILTICASLSAVLIGSLAAFTGGNAQEGLSLVPRWIGLVSADPYEFAGPITVAEFIEGDEGTLSGVLLALSQIDAEYRLERTLPQPVEELHDPRSAYTEMFREAPRVAIVTSKEDAMAVGTHLARSQGLRGRLRIGFGEPRSLWTTELNLLRVPLEGDQLSVKEIADELILSWSSKEFESLRQFVGGGRIVSASYTFRLLRKEGTHVECVDLFITIDSAEGLSSGWFQLIGHTMETAASSTSDRTLKLIAVHPGVILLHRAALDSNGNPIEDRGRIRY